MNESTQTTTETSVTVYTAEQLDDIVLPGDETAGEQQEQTERPEFRIRDDRTAEWALGKIRDAEYEYKRIENLARQIIEEAKAKVEREAKKYEANTGYLKMKLAEYFDGVPHKKSKSQETYSLLTGKLVRKYGGVKHTIDNDKLVGWLRAAGRDDLIKTKDEPRWGELKKELDLGCGAVAVHTATGEIVDGVTLEQAPDIFTVDID